MQSTREDFLSTFVYLSDLFNVYKNEVNMITSYEELFSFELSFWEIKIVDIEIEEFDKIFKLIDKIKLGDISKLREFSYIKNYFKKILNKFIYQHNDKRDWRYRCPELCCTIYDIEIEIMFILEKLLDFTRMSPFELFQIMKSVEKINLQNVCNEKRQPYDIERYISKFIGF